MWGQALQVSRRPAITERGPRAALLLQGPKTEGVLTRGHLPDLALLGGCISLPPPWIGSVHLRPNLNVKIFQWLERWDEKYWRFLGSACARGSFLHPPITCHTVSFISSGGSSRPRRCPGSQPATSSSQVLPSSQITGNSCTKSSFTRNPSSPFLPHHFNPP